MQKLYTFKKFLKFPFGMYSITMAGAKGPVKKVNYKYCIDNENVG